MKAIRFSFRGLRIAFVVAELALVLVMASVLVPRLLGQSVLVVKGGSMGGAYPLGSVAFTHSVPAGEVEVGDVIGIRATPDEPGILHRIVKIEKAEGQTLVYTKGDANRRADPEPSVLQSEVQVAGGHLPHVGYLLGIVMTPMGWMAFMVLPGAALATVTVLRIWRTPVPEPDWAAT